MKIRDLFETETTPSIEKVYKWLDDHNDSDIGNNVDIENISISNGKVTIDEEAHFNMKNSPLPFKFADEHKHRLSMFNASSLVGCPKKCGAFDVYSKHEISFEGAPEQVSSLTVDLPSLKDIHKHIKTVCHTSAIENTIYVSSQLQRCILGLIMINGVENIKLENSTYVGASDNYEKLKTVVGILNKHLSDSNKHKAVIAVQQELIDADLDEYADV